MNRLVYVLVACLCWTGVAWGADMLPPEPTGTETPAAKGGDSVSIDLADVFEGAPQTRVRGALSASYTYSIADPESHRGANAYRVSDPDHNTFALSHGVIGLEREVQLDRDFDVGYAADLVTGRVVELGYEDGLLRSGAIAIGQANVKVKTPMIGGLVLGLGKEYGWFGLESIDLSRNFHHSLSYAIESAPRTVTGLSARVQLLEGVSYTQYVSNGADLAIDGNDQKSLGGRFLIEGERGWLALNYFVGAERIDSEGDLSWIAEVAASYKLTDALTVGGLVRVGQEDVAGDTFEFGLAQATARLDLFDGKFSLGARASVLYDEDGMITGREQKLLEVTATAELRPVDQIGFGVEYRHDVSSESDAFAGSRGANTRRDMDTLSLFLRVRF